MAHSPSLKKCFISHKKVQSGVIHQEFWQHVSFQLITAIHCQSANAMISKSSWLHSLIPNGQWQHQNVSKWVIWIAFCLVLKNASGTASPCQPHNTGLARRGFVRRCFWCGLHWLLPLQRPPYMFMGVLDCFGTGTAKGSSYARVSAIHSLWIWVRQIFLFKGCQRFPGSRDMDGFALLTCQLAKSPICLWLFLEHSPPHNTGLARRCFVRRCFWCGTHWLLLFSVCLTWCSWAR